jgi:hypothetical protein
VLQHTLFNAMKLFLHTHTEHSLQNQLSKNQVVELFLEVVDEEQSQMKEETQTSVLRIASSAGSIFEYSHFHMGL